MSCHHSYHTKLVNFVVLQVVAIVEGVTTSELAEGISEFVAHRLGLTQQGRAHMISCVYHSLAKSLRIGWLHKVSYAV